MSSFTPLLAVVIPSYRVRAHILSVIERIGPEVAAIYVVDDACPEESGRFVRENAADPRVRVIHNEENQGVGGATMAGMKQAAADGADVVIRIDGDGQMDPALIPSFVGVILSGEADYAKGNRFFEPEGLAAMPLGRLIGNAGLSFLSKISSGYWHSFDPTNGYVAVHAGLIGLLPLEKISKRYFFESDLLFRLNILTARVVDVATLRQRMNAAGHAHVPILEDCAQAHGARIGGRRVGGLGDIATFSFYPTKNLGAFDDAGAIAVPDGALAEACDSLRQYGWAGSLSSPAKIVLPTLGM